MSSPKLRASFRSSYLPSTYSSHSSSSSSFYEGRNGYNHDNGGNRHCNFGYETRSRHSSPKMKHGVLKKQRGAEERLLIYIIVLGIAGLLLFCLRYNSGHSKQLESEIGKRERLTMLVATEEVARLLLRGATTEQQPQQKMATNAESDVELSESWSTSSAVDGSRMIWEEDETLVNEAFHNNFLSNGGEPSTNAFIPLTRKDSAFAELPVPILGSSLAAAKGTVSFWIKLLERDEEDDVHDGSSSSRVLWTNQPMPCPDSGQGMTFSIESKSLFSKQTMDYWWKLEYATHKGHCYSFSVPFDTMTKNDGTLRGQWTHIALTLDTSISSSSTSISLYVNGVPLASHSFLPSPVTHVNSSTILGQTYDHDDPSTSLHGYLAMMAIWKGTALSADQIKHVYHVGAVDESVLFNMNSRGGLVRNPTYLFPLDDAAKLKRSSRQFQHMELESSFKLRELMHGDPVSRSPTLSSSPFDGTFIRHVQIPPFEHLGGYRYVEYIDGKDTSPKTFDQQALVESDNVARKRRVYVRNAMKHAWNGYKKYAWGYDELRPQSKKGDNNWGAQGTTIVDSLSTLWIMGMQDEFYEGRDWVRDHLSYNIVGEVSVFETTIRNLGGLLAAFDVSEDVSFLEKANDLGSRLLRSISDNPSGIPYGMTVLNDTSVTGKSYNKGWLGNNAVLAELGTLQLEFRYLAAATGKNEYATAVNRIFQAMEKMNPEDGLYPIYILNDGKVPKFGNRKVTFGAMGDSFYEYMLKVWLQGGKRERIFRKMYDRAMDGLHKRLITRSDPNGLTYIAELNGKKVDHRMDHLACFMGGLLALGAFTNPDGMGSVRAQRDLQTAKALTYTCYQMYARTETGLSSEFVSFKTSDDRDFVKGRNAPFYILRPETAESLYVLHALTGDPIYREWGWEIFQSIERFCRTESAYGSVSDVDESNETPEDRMESFFLAETLKYLYLIQDPDNTLDLLNTHVFNTEAHPLRLLDKVKKTKSRESMMWR